MATPYMGLTLPTVSVTAGPLYATENNAAFTTIDSHNHTSGQGAQIPTLGLNINADLSFATYNALQLRSSRYVNSVAPLALAADLNCVYFSGGELYANDASGNQVKITSGGAVNVSGSGNITGMGATTATVAYSAGSQTFTFSSNTNVAAFLSTSSLSIATTTASAESVTLASGVLTGGAYTLTLPVAVATTNNAILMSSNAGALSYLPLGSSNLVLRVNSGGTAIEYAQIQSANIASATITGSNIASTTVAKSNLVALGQQVSSDVSSFLTSSTSFTDVTGLSVTITTSGRPVFVGVLSLALLGGGGSSAWQVVQSTSSGFGTVRILRDASEIATFINFVSFSGGITASLYAPTTPIQTIDIVAAGTYTYKVQLKCTSSFNNGLTNVRLIAYEL